MPRVLACVALFALSTSAFAEHPPGAILDDVVVVDLTDDGLRAFLPLANQYIPSSFVLPQVASATTFPQPSDNCAFFGACYQYDVQNLNLDIQLLNPAITPRNGAIDLTATVQLTINSPGDRLEVYVRGEAANIEVTQDCRVYSDAFVIPVNAVVQLDFNPNTGIISADLLVNPIDFGGLTSDDVYIQDCALGTINQIASIVGFDLVQLALDQVTPLLQDQVDTIVSDLNNQLAPLLDDAAGMVRINQTIDLLGMPLDIDIEAQDLEITSGGVRIRMQGGIDAPSDPCVAEFGITGSLETSSSISPISGINSHVSVLADDDLLNQGMFAIWNGGLLCQTIDSNTPNIPLTIDTNLLALLAPTVYDSLIPQAAPMVIITRPTQPPLATLDGPNDINVTVDGLGLGFYTDVDGRRVRLFDVGLSAEAGADIAFNGATGVLGLNIDFETSDIVAQMAYNEFHPEASAGIETSLLGFVDDLAGPAIEGLLGDQAFNIPSFQGYGLSSAAVGPAAGAPDRLGVTGNLGPVGYTGGCDGGGCDAEEGGCGDTGGACNSGRAPGRAILFTLPLLLAGFRRRVR